MRSFFHLSAYHVARTLAKAVFAWCAKIHVMGSEEVQRDGAFILAANHISHFDPPIIATTVPRKIDWMAMAEFFPYPVLGHILRAIDCLPTDRHRADRRVLRSTLDRLKRGRIVGMFPEGGIRDGAASLLAGASLRPGVSTLAHMADVPVIPCVILGSDRLYSGKRWRPSNRAPVWIGFGSAIFPRTDLAKTDARARMESELAAAFQLLCRQMCERFSLTINDLPQPPKERMKE
jgi:1-acyl-sn-glycerol-3-phosphate acyltransferase